MLFSTRDFIRDCEAKVLAGKQLEFDEGLQLISVEGPDVLDLIAAANRVRHEFKGDIVNLCSIVNAKSGACSENCSFCAQSAHFKTEIETYPLMNADEIVQAAQEVGRNGAQALGIVAAWKGLKEGPLLENVLDRVRVLSSTGLKADASLGIISDLEIAHKLKEAGLHTYNHNLETAESHFNNICTTHTYQDRVQTIRFLKEAGIRVCSGGIFGMGENLRQRVEMAMALRELEVDVVPLNFLHAIHGTPLEGVESLVPMEILKIIATYRLLLPEKDIMTAGGRELHLRDLQSWMYAAGANHTLIGNYLTTEGRKAEEDLRMIRDLGLKVASDVVMA
jgi:biotin synthase